MATGTGKRPKLLSMASLEEAAGCLRLLGHPVRLRIVDLLMQGRFPVYQIARFCGLPSHQASEHLRLMQGHGLLTSRRRGQSVYYAIAEPNLPGVLNCIRRNCKERQTVRA